MADQNSGNVTGKGGHSAGEGRAAGRGGPRRPRGGQGQGAPGAGSELTERVIFINRAAKVVKGGRRFSFSALVVAGDRQGRVGLGTGKANEVADAIRKGGEAAKRNMRAVALHESSIPHSVTSHFDGASVLLRPASPGTGVIAGKTVRAVLDAAGLKNVLSKSLGSRNPGNVAKATLEALRSLRLKETIYRDRGLPLKEGQQEKETVEEQGT